MRQRPRRPHASRAANAELDGGGGEDVIDDDEDPAIIRTTTRPLALLHNGGRGGVRAAHDMSAAAAAATQRPVVVGGRIDYHYACQRLRVRALKAFAVAVSYELFFRGFSFFVVDVST